MVMSQLRVPGMMKREEDKLCYQEPREEGQDKGTAGNRYQTELSQVVQ